MANPTKSEKIKKLLAVHDYAGAICIAKSFFYGLTPNEKRTLQIASECMGNKARTDFYKSIRVDVQGVITEAVKLIKDKYN